LFDVRSQISYAFLRSVKLASRLFFGYEIKWVGDVPDDPWADARIITILNHTSLYEPLFAGGAPDRLLKRIAGHGVVPVADKTVQRPLVGRFFRLVAEDVMPITRERDDTWERFITQASQPDSVAVILPEGRMKRKTGLDQAGNPMTIRGGIADIIRAVPDGRMLMCYSRGLHHIQAPGELLPRPFRTVKARLETVDLPTYREKLLESAGEEGFKRAVIEDLTRRRDLYCH
jgi:1-acyl-sn-glycerol-3-phosphate acyltransferase